MRMRKRAESEILEGDLTPMIDMTFQLIAFFMVLINFSQTEADQRILLPESVLAKPPDRPLRVPDHDPVDEGRERASTEGRSWRT